MRQYGKVKVCKERIEMKCEDVRCIEDRCTRWDHYNRLCIRGLDVEVDEG